MACGPSVWSVPSVSPTGTPRRRTRPAAVLPAAVVATALAGAAAHIGPAATWLPAVRSRWFPALDGRGHPGRVALTFDDGPDPDTTPHFIDALAALGVRATFFVLGAALERAPATGRALAAAGHELAVHGWGHGRPWLPVPGRERREIRATVAAVTALCGTPPVWYRPPFGILTGGRWAAARNAGLRPVLWSAWGRDWTPACTARTVLDEIGPGVRPGATLLLHDTDRMAAPGCWKATLAALPGLVALCRERGLEPGPLAVHHLPPR